MNQRKNEKVKEILADMRRAIGDAINITRMKTADEFVQDRQAALAVARLLETIGRKASQLRKLGYSDQHPSLPWAEMIGMERKLNHPYQEIAPEILWATVKQDLPEIEPFIFSVLREESRKSDTEVVYLSSIRLLSEHPMQLTPTELRLEVEPYLESLEAVQIVVDEIGQRPHHPVVLKSISQQSPISVNLEGAVDAIVLIRDMFVKWRREHAKKMSQLEEQEKATQIESYLADVEEKRARARRESVEARRIENDLDPERSHVDIERMLLENEKLRIEIEAAKVDLALSVLSQLAPDLSLEQKVSYTLQLLKPLGVLVSSPFDLVVVDSHQIRLTPPQSS